jgi:hypothetical protein
MKVSIADLSGGALPTLWQLIRELKSRRIRFVSLILLAVCCLALPACSGSDGAKAGPIQVVSGTYGANCAVPAGNVTDDLKAKCNGKNLCDYVVDYMVLGDPKVGCAKDYQAKWTCGGSPEIHEASLPPEAGTAKQIRFACGPN